MGGTYNEPNTNLTGPETSIRNFVHGIGFQRDVLGAHPATAWQLDVFGHDPQFPGMAADAGLTSSSWARGPHHQWGPMADGGDPRRMQFRSEFEWIAPSGRGPADPLHAGPLRGRLVDGLVGLAGRGRSRPPTSCSAALKSVALTRNVLLPVGTDYTPPNAWVTDIHRDWNARYTWPRFVCALPSGVLRRRARRTRRARRRAVAADPRHEPDLHRQGRLLHRHQAGQPGRRGRGAGRRAVRDVRRAALRRRATRRPRWPRRGCSWPTARTTTPSPASESDQVYLDLLTGWRDAWELGRGAAAPRWRCCPARWRAGTARWWCGTRWRTTEPMSSPCGSTSRSTSVRGGRRRRHRGADPGRATTGTRSAGGPRDVGSLGWRTYRLRRRRLGHRAGSRCRGDEIANEHLPAAGRPGPRRRGGVAGRADGERELIARRRGRQRTRRLRRVPGAPARPGEGPWHLLPKGPVQCSSAAPPRRCSAYRSPLGRAAGGAPAPSGTCCATPRR